MNEVMKTLDTAYAELEQISVRGVDVERMYHVKRLLSQAYQQAQPKEESPESEVNTDNG